MLTWFVFKSYEKGYFIATSRTPPSVTYGVKPHKFKIIIKEIIMYRKKRRRGLGKTLKYKKGRGKRLKRYSGSRGGIRL